MHICITVLLYVEFNELQGSVFLASIPVSTHPHLDILSGRAGQFLAKPRGRVESAAGTVRSTTLPIPQGIDPHHRIEVRLRSQYTTGGLQ